MVCKQSTSRPSWRCTLSADGMPDGRSVSATSGRHCRTRYANAEAAHHLPKDSPCCKHFRRCRTHAARTGTPICPWCLADGGGGLCAPEVERAYARAQALCEHVGDSPQLWLGAVGVVTVLHGASELQMARKLAERLINLAQSLHDLDLLLAAHNGLGTVLTVSGRVTGCPCPSGAEYCPLRSPKAPLPRILLWGEPQGGLSSTCGSCLVAAGISRAGSRRSQEALALGYAQKPLHPYTLAHAPNYGAVVITSAVRTLAGSELRRGGGFQGSTDLPRSWGGGRSWEDGRSCSRGREKKAWYRCARACPYRATGAESWRPYISPWPRHTTKGERGRGAPPDDRGTHVDEIMGDTGGKPNYIGSEENSCWGKRAQARNVVEAEQCFQQALAIARNQQAKSLELRAASELESSLAGTR